ncbi:MAG: hypothetical protein ABJB74_10855 [Gemmatimonas sp.]
MNDQTNQHLPSPEFRASLERDVVQAFRRQSQFSAPPSVTRRARLRTAATLVIGLALGAGGVAASAQVQTAKQRDVLSLSLQEERMILAFRLQLAQADLETIDKAAKAGVRPQGDLADARLNLRAAEVALQRSSLNEEEIRASASAPRDELWAPLIGGRDFVMERLKLEAALAAERLNNNESKLQNVRVRQVTGLLQQDSPEEMEQSSITAESTRAFRRFDQKISLRERFLHKSVDQQRIAVELQFMNVNDEFARLVSKLNDAKLRSQRAKDQQAIGLGTLVDLKRAELDELVTSIDAQRVKRVLDSLQAAALKKRN